MPISDRKHLENEVNATIKAVMLVCEELAALPPEIASQPETFNATRHALIRRIWNLAKECISYGATSVQHDEYR